MRWRHEEEPESFVDQGAATRQVLSLESLRQYQHEETLYMLRASWLICYKLGYEDPVRPHAGTDRFGTRGGTTWSFSVLVVKDEVSGKYCAG